VVQRELMAILEHQELVFIIHFIILEKTAEVAQDVVVTPELTVTVVEDVIVIRKDAVAPDIRADVVVPFIIRFLVLLVESVEMVEEEKVMVSPQLLDHQDNQEHQADAQTMVDLEILDSKVAAVVDTEEVVIVFSVMEEVSAVVEQEDQSQDQITSLMTEHSVVVSPI